MISIRIMYLLISLLFVHLSLSFQLQICKYHNDTNAFQVRVERIGHKRPDIPNAANFTLVVQSTITVNGIKGMIYQNTNIPCDYQRIYFISVNNTWAEGVGFQSISLFNVKKGNI